MTNNRKPVDEVRLSLSAARRREAGTHLYERLADKDMRDKPYTPPPNVAAWLQAQADKPKAGRDYDAILRAAKKKPVGYYEDAPTGIKFGVQPLPSASTKPHGKGVDTADGPWPRYFIPTDPSKSAACIFVDAHTSDVFWRGFTNKDRRLVTHNALPEAGDKRWSEVNVSAFAQWLEQNGHRVAAAQLLGKDATGGGRVWKFGNLDWRGCVIEGRAYQAWDGVWRSIGTHDFDTDERYTELFGPEKDAVLAECRKAMGLPNG